MPFNLFKTLKKFKSFIPLSRKKRTVKQKKQFIHKEPSIPQASIQQPSIRQASIPQPSIREETAAKIIQRAARNINYQYCSICQEQILDTHNIVPGLCGNGHLFHLSCLEELISFNYHNYMPTKCPNCRKEINIAKVLDFMTTLIAKQIELLQNQSTSSSVGRRSVNATEKINRLKSKLALYTRILQPYILSEDDDDHDDDDDSVEA
jgi:phage FluMu protein Com